MKNVLLFFSFVSVTLIGLGCSKPKDGVTAQSSFIQEAPYEFQGSISQLSTEPICSDLNFTGATFSSSLPVPEREALKLALNISGSFEGHDGWANVTGDFDGMGLSLGLLNQNLGSGSLQPLLIQLRNKGSSLLTSHFSAPHATSLLNMLSAWESHAAPASWTRLELSPLDRPVKDGLQPTMTASEESAAWARQTLYVNGVLNTVWASEFKAVGESPNYVSVQVNQSLFLHNDAVELLTLFKLKELRSYLFLFDVKVQNGGFYQNDIDDYLNWLKTNASATESIKLQQLLALRLRHVLTKWQEDVRRRKLTIILGEGTVHGSDRALEDEYCFNRRLNYL